MKLSFARLCRSLVLSAVLLMAFSVPSGAVAAGVTSDPGLYPLNKCIVSGEDLGDQSDAVIKDYDGREMRFCCKGCVKDFEKDQASFLQKLDKAIIQAQLADYPLETCVVSGEALGGEMGDPIDHVVGNRLVRLCCKMCKKELAADPAKYIARLDEAVVAAQLDGYPASTCPITGEALEGMGEPYDYVFAGKLVRFCCDGCVSKFNENPAQALATIYEATPEAEPHNEPENNHSGHRH